VNTHWAWPTCSTTSSWRKAASSAARLAPQEGHTPRRLTEPPTRRSAATWPSRSCPRRGYRRPHPRGRRRSSPAPTETPEPRRVERDGKPFLALELVEGEDLKDRLARGAIPVDEALEIAEQIAEALDEAHNKGIVHRDLKPANVKLTPDGKVKVLDFGLAKAWAGEAPDGSSSSAALSQSPTLAHTGTVAGLILGTAA